MPRLSDTMEEGTILRWLKRDGEQVRRGEELVEIETDKATMIYESDLEGVLALVAGEGDTLAVGELIAHVGDSASPVGQGAQGDQAEDGPAARPASVLAQSAVAEAGGSHAAGIDAAASLPAPSPAPERVRASPLAKRMARESGVDLHTLTGSGPGGRIVKADVQGAGASAEAPAPSPGASRRPRAAHLCSRSHSLCGHRRGSRHGEGRDHDGRAHAHPADDRPQDGRVEGHHPRFHACRWRSTWRSA